MMEEDFCKKLEKLRELAEKATPGIWFYDKMGCAIRVIPKKNPVFWLTAGENHINDANYAAAANPAMILEMIEEYERLRSLLLIRDEAIDSFAERVGEDNKFFCSLRDMLVSGKHELTEGSAMLPVLLKLVRKLKKQFKAQKGHIGYQAARIKALEHILELLRDDWREKAREEAGKNDAAS